jgi:hypothetical protein
MIDAFTIADAVRDRINGGEYDLPVNATTVIPRTDRLEDVRGLQITVLPTAIDTEPLSRSEDESIFQVSIGIQKHLETTGDAEVRTLHALVRAIQARVKRFNVIDGTECAAWQGGTISPIWSASNLIQRKMFTSVIDLVYRVAE